MPADASAFVDPFGHRVDWERFDCPDARAVAIVLPGANIPGRFYRWLGEALAAAGIDTVVLSPVRAPRPARAGVPPMAGRYANPHHVRLAMDAVRATGDQLPVVLGGHSQGAATILEALVPDEARRNPYSGVDGSFGIEGPVAAAFCLGGNLEARATREQPMPWRSSTRLLPLDPPVPVLGIAATNDQLSPPEYVRNTLQRLQPPGRYVEIAGGNHFGWCHGEGLRGRFDLDGPLAIPPEEQQRQTLDALVPFLLAAVAGSTGATA